MHGEFLLAKPQGPCTIRVLTKLYNFGPFKGYDISALIILSIFPEVGYLLKGFRKR